MAGWPFLVARGRRRGYSVLLAPDFLVAAGEYGFLEDVVGPVRPGSAVRVAAARTSGGRPVCLVWTEHRVTAADLLGAGEDPVDEHSRPLDLLHGVLFSGVEVDAVAPADLDHAHHAALDTYRRFLADEEAFVVARSPAFDAATTVTPPPTTPSRTRKPSRASTHSRSRTPASGRTTTPGGMSAPGGMSDSGRTPAPRRTPGPGGTPMPGRTPTPGHPVALASLRRAWLPAALVVGALGLFLGVRGLTSTDDPPPPPPPPACTSVTSVAPTSTPTPTPAQPPSATPTSTPPPTPPPTPPSSVGTPPVC